VFEEHKKILSPIEQFLRFQPDGFAVFRSVLRLAQPEVCEIRREHLGDLQLLRFGQAQRDIALLEQRVDLLIEPGCVPEFEGKADVRRQKIQGKTGRKNGSA
jgi:hypothetical protein